MAVQKNATRSRMRASALSCEPRYSLACKLIFSKTLKLFIPSEDLLDVVTRVAKPIFLQILPRGIFKSYF
jgi:hypothetical protein